MDTPALEQRTAVSVGLSVSPFKSQRTPQDWQELINRADAFRDAYVDFLNDTIEDCFRGVRPADTPQRRNVMELAVRAEKAVNAVGVKLAVAPPPVYSGQSPRYGLTQVAFAHEDEMFRGFSSVDQQGSHDLALDAIGQVRATLIDRKEEAERDRRRVLYWPDRVLRSVLGFPAYLLSLVFGFRLTDVKPQQGRILWLMSVLADVIAMVAAGEWFGWWTLLSR